MAFDKLTMRERITAVHVDMMKHSDFTQLGGLTQIGSVFIDSSVPTACTNGRDVWYSEEFIAGMSREQLRYLCAHENFHKALHHCTAYKDVCEKYPQESGQAMDYVVNLLIEEMDAGRGFVARPTSIPPLIDKKFTGMSFLEVLALLRKEKQEGGGGKGRGQPMDEHKPGEAETEEAGQELRQQIEDAIVQGKLTSQNLKRQRGEGAGSAALDGYVERHTDWRKPLRKFVQEVAEGDDLSRYAPPNRRMMPLDILLPSHFSESVGELVVACDTSGSMAGVYPIVFGEIAAICKSVLPEKVRVLWWDTRLAGEQIFTPGDYDKIRTLVKPVGGGGTTVSCVAQYIKEKKIKPKATLIITDGYVEASYDTPPGPLLWGVVDNPGWRPLRGMKVNIHESD